MIRISIVIQSDMALRAGENRHAVRAVPSPVSRGTTGDGRPPSGPENVTGDATGDAPLSLRCIQRKNKQRGTSVPYRNIRRISFIKKMASPVDFFVSLIPLFYVVRSQLRPPSCPVSRGTGVPCACGGRLSPMLPFEPN